MKEKIRPIYNELQGYLSQAPDKDKGYIFQKEVWEQVITTIDELNEISESNFDKFKPLPKSISWNGTMKQVIDSDNLRLKLNGLINRLYGQYFSDEISPFSGAPGTNIQMNQQQNQITQVQILLEIQSMIDRKLNETTDPKEKNFLEKIKSSLSSIKNISELLSLILSTGLSMGLTLEQIEKLFK